MDPTRSCKNVQDKLNDKKEELKKLKLKKQCK